MGCKTEKLKYGHRGVNQPVKDLQTGRTYISSQNHGYAVVNDTIEASGGTLRWVNANDGHLRRDRLPCPERLYGTVPSGGMQRAPRHPLFVRPIFTDDGRREPCR